MKITQMKLKFLHGIQLFYWVQSSIYIQFMTGRIASVAIVTKSDFSFAPQGNISFKNYILRSRHFIGNQGKIKLLHSKTI